MHDGSIEARSAGPDKGSEFVVRLPLVQHPQEPPKIDVPRAKALSGCRILVVEDNVDAADSLGELLRLQRAEDALRSTWFPTVHPGFLCPARLHWPQKCIPHRAVSYNRAGSRAGRCAAPSGGKPGQPFRRGHRQGRLVDVGRRRILCVDDNHDVADSTVELLHLVGFEAVACYGGPHALAVAPDFRPDACLIDLNMPGMDGDELACRLRELFAGRATLFVAVTARGDEESRRRTAAAGFELHLVKPVDPHDLLRVVDELWRVADNAKSDLLVQESKREQAATG